MQNEIQSGTPDRRILDIVQTPHKQVDNQQSQQASSVNRQVKDNELAGGVNLSSYTNQPKGFELYMTAMQDGNFYASKEIYKGQKNVDNARLLRGLSQGSEKLFQEMINEQYKYGN